MLENKELAFLSKTLGTINLEVPIESDIQELKLKEWNKEEVVELFKKLRFNRFMDRFGLRDIEQDEKQEEKKVSEQKKQIEPKVHQKKLIPSQNTIYSSNN